LIIKANQLHRDTEREKGSSHYGCVSLKRERGEAASINNEKKWCQKVATARAGRGVTIVHCKKFFENNNKVYKFGHWKAGNWDGGAVR
jgi:hypothetical protein